jgi:hypothetical protein
MLPAQERLPGSRALIDEGLYFVVHAPRQTGKTTTLEALADAVSAARDRVAIYVSCETAQVAGDDYGAAEDIILQRIRQSVLRRGYPESWLPPAVWPQAPAGVRINTGLSEWAGQCPVPLVLLFDEIDAMLGPSMMTVLRQLRDGFRERPDWFPASVVICGLRDVRDYKLAAGGDPSRVGGVSPFNIAVKSIRIGDFTRAEIAELYSQHTADTGQEFTDEAVTEAYCYTAGQPWLVNALAREIIVEMGVPASTPITARHMDQAKERLIAARATHLDSLVDKLNDPRVRRIIEPLVAGRQIDIDTAYHDDAAYVRDLGLIAPKSPVAVANPIYREVLSRVLAQPVMDAVTDHPRSFILPDGRIDLDKLLREFVAFWREQGELMANGKGYEEAGAQLVLLGYLYRIVNGGGFVDSQYGIGRRRIDVLIRKPYTDADGTSATQRKVLELKVWYPGESDPIDEGLDQLDTYLASLGMETGTLVIFDRRPTAAPVAERGVFTDEVTADGRKVRLLRV